MTKQEILEKCTKAGILQVATMDGNQPRVRTVMLYRADGEGIIFHTLDAKDLFKQVEKNAKSELCFNCQNEMIRVTGELEIVEDMKLKEEIVAHPSRGFIRAWKENGIVGDDFLEHMKVLRMTHGTATVWTMETNFAPKEYIEL